MKTEKVLTKRVPCAFGCGTMVLPEKGECRNCRRKRLLKGRRQILASMPNGKKITPPFETAKQKFDRVRGKVWNRPKLSSIVREMMRPFRPIDPEASLAIWSMFAMKPKKSNPSPVAAEEGQVVEAQG